MKPASPLGRFAAWLAVAGMLVGPGIAPVSVAADVLPKHVTPETLRAIRSGLDFLARSQNKDGGWANQQDGRTYPAAMTGLAGMAFIAHGNTCTRGKYAQNVQAAVDYLATCSDADGLISGPGNDSGMPMHGHGFALLFLASAYSSVKKGPKKEKLKVVIEKAVQLTSRGQSNLGGWTYTPGHGDEGSVTVTQVQALRACHNAGFIVPKSTIERAVKYIEMCGNSDGGIRYSFGSGGGSMIAISAAAVATLYNAGEFDAPIAERCLEFVDTRFRATKGWSKGSGHEFYMHLYASQGFYMAGDKHWDAYFPETRDELIRMQNRGDGSWTGDGIGQVFGTAVACTILQLPFKFCPVYQR